MEETNIFYSHRFDLLVKQLYKKIESDKIDIFDSSLIIIPNRAVKEWIMLECAEIGRGKSLINWNFTTWQQGLTALSGPLPLPTRLELSAALWSHCSDPPDEWKKFLGSPKKQYHFVESLAEIFYDYFLHGAPEAADPLWKIEVFRNLCSQYGWKSMPDSLANASVQYRGSVYLFGVDWLPPAAYRFYCSHERSRVFQFSPTAMFWEDFQTARERKAVLARGKKKGFSKGQLDFMDALLREEQPLLANWGAIGRKMLEEMEGAIRDEAYELASDAPTLLNALRRELLSQETIEKKSDDSIQLLQTGASLLREVEAVRDEIVKLARSGIPYSDMRVYAPDISVYAPLIEFAFGGSIPWRVSGVDLAAQSSYYRGFLLLSEMALGRWKAADWIALLETRAFYQKQKWQTAEIEQIAEWIDFGKVKWGMTGDHRSEITQETIGCSAIESGNWEEGLDRLIDSWIYHFPEQRRTLNWSDADLFQQFLTVFEEVKALSSRWKEEKTLGQWAEEFESALSSYLELDDTSEEDRTARANFSGALEALRTAHRMTKNQTFPLSFVQNFLFAPSKAEKNGTMLHGVRFSSLEPGAVLPAKALFLMGMDEESFPRSSSPLLIRSGKTSGFIPRKSDWDRYLFLQTLFAAQEKLVISYCHQSKEDGKLVSPSLLVQELWSYLQSAAPTPRILSSLSIDEENFYDKAPSSFDYDAALSLRSGAVSSLFSSPLPRKIQEPGRMPESISIEELRSWLKNSFAFYLQDQMGLKIKEEAGSQWDHFECSALERYLFLKDALRESPEKLISTLDLPEGILGQEIKRDLLLQANEMRRCLTEWNISERQIETARFTETNPDHPPIFVQAMGKEVKILGEAPFSVPGGSLCLGAETIAGALKVWPEVLAACIANGGNQIFFLKTGKKRLIENPLAALQSLVELYLELGGAPIFLHPEWADSILRKERAVDEELDDRVMRWALSRSPRLHLEEERLGWTPLLQSALSSLVELFPSRKGGALADV